jgi:hypothetical protein
MERPDTPGRDPTLRALIAQALADVVTDDPALTGAVAVHEEWRAGYIGRLLVSAELLATQWTSDFGVPEAVLPVTDAVRRAVDNANPRGSIATLHRPVTDEARAAMVALLRAQAEFHRCAGGLERRQVRRPESDDQDISDLVND